MRPIVRPATPADLASFYAAHPVRHPTMSAWVGELNGKVIAVGGFAHLNGRLIAFYDMDEQARPYRVTLVRAARRIVDDMAKTGRLLFARLDPDEDGERWVRSLGFDPVAGYPGLFRRKD